MAGAIAGAAQYGAMCFILNGLTGWARLGQGEAGGPVLGERPGESKTGASQGETGRVGERRGRLQHSAASTPNYEMVNRRKFKDNAETLRTQRSAETRRFKNKKKTSAPGSAGAEGSLRKRREFGARSSGLETNVRPKGDAQIVMRAVVKIDFVADIQAHAHRTEMTF